MPMNEEQIERAIREIMAAEAGVLYGAAANAQRSVAGKRVFDAIGASLSADMNAAGEEDQAKHDNAR